jgi:hypothetical protein
MKEYEPLGFHEGARMDEPPDHPKPTDTVPVTVLPASAWAAGPEPSGGRNRWLIIGGLVVVAAGAAGVAVAMARGGQPTATRVSPSPAPSPTIFAPVALTEEAEAFAVTLSWTQPGGGTEIARYSVYRNGVHVAAVTPPTTTYTDEDVAPGKKYTYEIEALGDGLVSDRASIDVKTKVPPLKDARVQGTFNVSLTTTSQYGFQESLGKFTLGWRFSPKCDSGACNVTVKVLSFKELKGTLKREGTSYTGHDNGKFNASCAGTRTSSTLTFHLTVKKAKAISDEWRATKLVGSLKQVDPAGLGCIGAGATYSVTAKLV